MEHGDFDPRILRNIGYGLYIVGVAGDGKLNGQLANTVFQITSQPPQILISLSKMNFTHEILMKQRRFSVSVLDESAPLVFIGLFGFRSGRDLNKLAQVKYEIGLNGCPIVVEHTTAAFEAEIKMQIDCGSHTLFIGQVTATRLLSGGRPMSYSFYQQNLKGKTPLASPTYIP
jgi:ferric-chelate reductase [NAD(P)H]